MDRKWLSRDSNYSYLLSKYLFITYHVPGTIISKGTNIVKNSKNRSGLRLPNCNSWIVLASKSSTVCNHCTRACWQWWCSQDSCHVLPGVTVYFYWLSPLFWETQGRQTNPLQERKKNRIKKIIKIVWILHRNGNRSMKQNFKA